METATERIAKGGAELRSRVWGHTEPPVPDLLSADYRNCKRTSVVIANDEAIRFLVVRPGGAMEEIEILQLAAERNAPYFLRFRNRA